MAPKQTTPGSAGAPVKRSGVKATAKKPPAKLSPDALEAEAATLVAKPPVTGVTREPVPTPEVAPEQALKLVKKDLIDRVIAQTNAKPRHVRQITDALLHELGAMLEQAETLQLPPLGTVKVQRRKAVDEGEVIVAKLRRKKPGTNGNDPLADPEE